jgi:hypothetical protein
MNEKIVKSSNRLIFLCAVGLALAATLTPSLRAQADETSRVVDIGSRRELFVDRHIIGALPGASLKLHTPQLMPPVSPPRPHGAYATVLKADDKFQFYYRGDTQPGNHWRQGLEQYHAGEVTLYAESEDAIQGIVFPVASSGP